MTRSSPTATRSDAVQRRYERVQAPLWFALLSTAVGTSIVFFGHGAEFKAAAVAVAFLGSAIGYFGWLRIVVDRESVRWYIGGKGGYPRGSIARLRIEGVQLVELGFREAWRARWTIWHGWRWTLLRFQGVEITTRDGMRTILGTRAPRALYRAIVEEPPVTP